jgi:hypothetical protein
VGKVATAATALPQALRAQHYKTGLLDAAARRCIKAYAGGGLILDSVGGESIYDLVRAVDFLGLLGWIAVAAVAAADAFLFGPTWRSAEECDVCLRVWLGADAARLLQPRAELSPSGLLVATIAEMDLEDFVVDDVLDTRFLDAYERRPGEAGVGGRVRLGRDAQCRRLALSAAYGDSDLFEDVATVAPERLLRLSLGAFAAATLVSHFYAGHVVAGVVVARASAARLGPTSPLRQLLAPTELGVGAVVARGIVPLLEERRGHFATFYPWTPQGLCRLLVAASVRHGRLLPQLAWLRDVAPTDPIYGPWARACVALVAETFAAMTEEDVGDALLWASEASEADSGEADARLLAAYALLVQVRHSHWSNDEHTRHGLGYLRLNWWRVSAATTFRAVAIAEGTTAVWPSLTDLVPGLLDRLTEEQGGCGGAATSGPVTCSLGI